MATDRPVILIVDDDETFRGALQALLARAGYEVLSAPDYRDALVILDSGRDIDLLLVDIVMPGHIHGLALARMAKVRRPHLPVIYITAYDLGDAAREASGPILRKPLDEAALMAEITRSLAAQPPV